MLLDVQFGFAGYNQQFWWKTFENIRAEYHRYDWINVVYYFMFIAHVVWNTLQSSILFNLNIVTFIVYNCSWLIIKTLKTKQYGKI